MRATPQRILVTGGSGTLGYNIIARLVRDDRYDVIAPVRSMDSGVVTDFKGRVQFVEHELSDAIHTAQIFERVNPDVIVHCAASGLRPPRASWFDLMHFNVESTMRLFQMNCRFDHHSRFIYISTGLVYREQGRPLTEDDPIETLHPYGASKAAGDAMLQAAAAEFKRPLTIIRPFAFTGPHDGGRRLFPLLLDAAVQGRTQDLTAGTQIRDFCAVSDIADAVLLAIEREQESLIEKYNLGSGRALPLKDLILEVCDELDLKVNLNFGRVPMHPYEPHHSVADTRHAAAQLNWRATTRVAYAVWELAQYFAPTLKLKRPERTHAIA
ncbi:MAG: NAD(P)-dependent oxidoreductase [Acidobacteriota bacterium]|nr:NAD(P)-dependent oxidoreductase [Acidobacteriota bacterium]